MLKLLLSRPLQITFGILFVLLLVGVFLLVCVLNHRTPVPKGCEKLRPDANQCAGCQLFSSCPIHRVPDKETKPQKKNRAESKEKKDHE